MANMTRLIFLCFSLMVANVAFAYDDLDHFSNDSFAVTKSEDGKNGGKRYLVERKGTWSDTLSVDLRFYPEVLGIESAKYFGFEIVDDHHMWIPDADEVRGTIEKYNATLPPDDSRRIAISVYSIPDASTSRDAYLEAFVARGAIPISKKGETFLRNASVRPLQGLFLPVELVQVLRNRIRFALELSRDLKKKFRNTSMDKTVTQLDEDIEVSLAQAVNQIEVLTLLMASLDEKNVTINWSDFEILFVKDESAFIDKWLKKRFRSASRTTRNSEAFEGKWMAVRNAIDEHPEASRAEFGKPYPESRLKGDFRKIASGGRTGFVETIKACARWLLEIVSPRQNPQAPGDRADWENALSKIEFSQQFIARLRYLKSIKH